MTSGEETSRDLTMRSVESRRSHRLSRRCEQEALIAVTPFENPCAERAAAVARQLRGEARFYFFVIPGRGPQPADPESIFRSRGYGFWVRRFAAPRNDGSCWRSPDDPAGGGGGGIGRRRRA